MGAMVVLGMKPGVILPCPVPCQCFILQVVSPVENMNAVVQHDFMHLGCFLLLLSCMTFLLFEISALDQLFLDLPGSRKVCEIQLFQKTLEVGDLLSADADLFLQVCLSLAVLAVSAVAPSCIALAVKLRIQWNDDVISGVVVIQCDFLLPLGVPDIVCVQKLAVFFPLAAVECFIVFLEQSWQLCGLMLELTVDHMIDIPADLPDALLFLLVVVQDVQTVKQGIFQTLADALEFDTVEGCHIVVVGNEQ